MPSKEDLGYIIVDTLRLSIELAAKEIIKQGNLTNLTEEEVINSIRSYRQKRKGLEEACSVIMSIYRRKNDLFDIVRRRKIDDDLD